MREVGGQSELWLVKAGDRILGPYEHSEVIHRLRSREIAVIDEISKPQSRWRYVREEPAFMGTVEEIRRENLNVQNDTHLTQTATITSTLSVDPVDPMDLTPTPVNTSVPEVIPNKKVEPVYNEPTPPAKRYGLQRDQTIYSDRKSNTPVYAAIILVLAVGLFWFMKNGPIKIMGGPPSASFATLKATGLRSIASGDYRKALSSLQEAQNLNSSDIDVQLGLASMLLKVEGQTAAARRLISDLGEVSPRQKKQIDVLMSFADLLSNESSQAIERLKKYSGLHDEHDRVIAYNLAVAYKMKMQSRDAKRKLEQIANDPKYGAPARLLLGLMYSATDRESAIQAIKPVIEPGAYKPRPFQQEALVLQSYLQMKSNNQKISEAAISATLAADPYATSYFTYDPGLYLQAVSWTQLRPYCEEVENRFEKSVEAKTLLAICELKSDRQARALELMNDALSQAPQDQLLLANNAYLLLEFGKDEEAKGSLRLAMRNSDSELALLLMAKACYESNDAICERESYKKILNLDSRHLTALVGLADLELRAGDAQAALDHYKQAVSLNPSFAPILRLKEKLP